MISDAHIAALYNFDDDNTAKELLSAHGQYPFNEATYAKVASEIVRMQQTESLRAKVTAISKGDIKIAGSILKDLYWAALVSGEENIVGELLGPDEFACTESFERLAARF